MKKILAQLNKEFMLFRRDKLLIMLAVLMPVVLMSLAGGTQSLRLRNVPLLVYDYDNTALSRTYLETYAAALSFRITAHEPLESPEEALSALARTRSTDHSAELRTRHPARSRTDRPADDRCHRFQCGHCTG